ncbi:MAG TPA: hypothetical protein VEK57_31475 [Thermoanaerobaculia bacterium]|nr:hypothetical protein [Thermoanaerobaculia bacterium]
MRHAVAVVVVFLLAAGSLSAATFEPVSDAALVQRAKLIVAGEVVSAASRLGADRAIVTDYRLAVRDVLKGEAGATVTITEIGGSANGIHMVISGSAKYTPGTRVLAFLKQRPDGSLFTSHMALGHFRFEKNRDGVEVLARDGEGVEIGDESALAPRHAGQFAKFVREIAGGVAESEATVVTHVYESKKERFQPVGNASAADYVLKAGNPLRPIRWEGCDDQCLIPFFTSGSQPSVNTNGAIDNAMEAWNGDPNSFVTLARAGTTSVTNIEVYDQENSILVNNTSSQTVGQCDNSIACGVVWASDNFTHSFDGTTFLSALNGDVLVRPGSYSQNSFEALMMHELGHGMALKHAPVAGNVMSSPVPNSGLNLRSWDAEAMAEVYGEGAPCNPPVITGVSGGGTKPYGQPAQLTVSVTGSAPFNYQWYRGNSGNTQEPVGSNSPNFNTPNVEAQMSFWVRVTSQCNPQLSDNSDTVTVTPTACTPASIATQPATPPRIQPGQTANLTVIGAGTTPLTYRWYRSNTAGDTSSLVFTGQNFTTPALQTSTSYWVRVSNACNQEGANSNVVTVTVGESCVPAAIVTQPLSRLVNVGGSVILTVVATGDAPLTYQWFEGTAPDTTKPINGATGASYSAGPFNAPGAYKYWVRVRNACNQNGAISQTATLTVPCPDPVKPVIEAPAAMHRSVPYVISWTGFTGAGWRYEVQEAANANFTDAKTFPPVNGATSLDIPAHTEIITDTRLYYRVRAITLCNNAQSAYSDPTSTLIQAPPTPTFDEDGGIFTPLVTSEDSDAPLTQGFVVGASNPSAAGSRAAATETFQLSADQPWVSFSPASGTVGAGGSPISMTVNPETLAVGSHSATVKIVRNDTAAGAVGALATTTTSIPLSISKVTPVSPVPRDTTPPAGTLIIPAVAHLDGVGTRFQSDVRIANASGETITYDLSFTPSGTNGTVTGKKTTINIPGGGNFALDDIVQVWFGAGSLGELGSGTLEIRPKSTAGGGTPNPLSTFASSRLYAISDKGTLGQFIPALTANKFVGPVAGDALARISLQQIAQSQAFRTNLGFVEGSGTPASLFVQVLDGNNIPQGNTTVNLAPYQHMQTSFSALFPNKLVTDGRVEMTVTSGGGKATAYASVLDNKTSDPLMVFPEQPARVSSARYVLPGIAELTNGASNFHSDMRLYNAASSPVTVTLNYYPQAGDATPRPAAVNRTIAAGQTLAVDDVLPTLWGLARTGGSVVVTAPNAASLVTTARTFSRDTNNGTYGQFIPGVTAADAVGLGERALQVMQLEDSTSYRSNLGLVEVTGSPVTIEITAIPPDGKTSAVTSLTLAPNEFRQIGRIFNSFGMQDVYNGRVAVKVLSGAGRVAAYGSVVDNRTVDPTYVPAQ